MDNSQFIHDFFYIDTTGSKSYGNLFYVKDILHSYGHHFKLAVKIGNTIYLNSSRYGNSTSKHQHITKHAVPCNMSKKYFNLKYMDDNKKVSFDSLVSYYDLTTKIIKNYIPYYNRARDKKQDYINEIQDSINQFNVALSLCTTDKRKLSKYIKFSKLSAENMIESLGAIVEKDQKQKELRVKKELLRAKKEKEIILQRHEESVKEWLNFEINTIFRYYQGTTTASYDYLRFKDQVIETTQGLKFSCSELVNLYNNYDHILQGSYISLKDTNYRVNLKTDQEIIIGCHKFKVDHIKTVFDNIINLGLCQ